MYKALAVVSFLTGTVLVVSSMWTLGITGTYLGDYSGILMDVRDSYSCSGDGVLIFIFDVDRKKSKASLLTLLTIRCTMDRL